MEKFLLTRMNFFDKISLLSMIYNSFSRKECIIVIMSKIESCVFLNANFFYVTNNTWKHAYRATSSPNNLIFVTEGTLYIEVLNVRYEVNKNEFLYLPLGFESIGFRPVNTDTGFFALCLKARKLTYPRISVLPSQPPYAICMQRWYKKAPFPIIPNRASISLCTACSMR